MTTTTQLIGWTEDLELRWDLFRAPVPSDAAPNDLAAIYMELKWHAFFKAERSGGTWYGIVTDAIVSNVMNPELSWARHDRVTDAALRHELYHFRLNEVYRKNAERALSSIRVSAATAEDALDTVNNRVCEVGATWESKVVAAQDRYETETNHGQNLSEQQRWEINIDAWLANPELAP